MSDGDKAMTVIRPPGRFDFPRLSELWGARDVLYQFGRRDVVLRYRQTAIGVLWVVIQPLAAAGVFAIVFGGVADLPSGNVPYVLFGMAGVLIWNVFSGIITRASGSLVANQALVSKVYFPRALIPLSSVLAVLLDFAVGLGLLVVMSVLFQNNPGWAVLTLPFWLLCAILLACGIGLAACAITVKYRDVIYALPWVIQILLYATPVAYSMDAVPADLTWLFNINPLTWLMEGARWATLGQAMPPAWQIIALPVVGLALLVAGGAVFQKMERGFADVI